MSNYNNEKLEKDFLISKICDQYRLCNGKNKITYTDFMQLAEKSTAIKYINQEHIKNCFWYGGIENADREILIFYPEKLSKELVMKKIDTILSCVHIELPKEIKMEHREYLSGIMKLGIVREKFGDIIIHDNTADIIAFGDIAEYFVNNLPLLTRFQKAKITLQSINQIALKETKFEEVTIIVSSIRLDNIVSELSHCSRNQAQTMLFEQRIFVNGICEMKDSKKVLLSDIITIRGKGKFIFDSIIGTTKSNKSRLKFLKYV